MAPQNLIAPIVEAIKEQYLQVESNNDLIENLENQIQNFQNRVNQVEKLINDVSELSSEVDLLKEQNTNLKDQLTLCCSQNMYGSEPGIMLNNESPLNDHDDPLFYENKIINIIPNPFSNVATIRYHLVSSINSAVLTFQNTEGKIINSRIINEKSDGQYIFEGTNYDAGIYFCTLWINGKKCDSRLLVLSK